MLSPSETQSVARKLDEEIRVGQANRKLTPGESLWFNTPSRFACGAFELRLPAESKQRESNR